MKPFSKTLSISLVLGVLFLGCSNDEISSNSVAEKPKVVVQSQPEVKVEEKKEMDPVKEERNQRIKEAAEAAKLATAVSYKELNDVFLDVAKLDPDNKYMILIFGAEDSPYCHLLKSDIKHDDILKKRLKEQFSTYYLNVSEQKKHTLIHEGKPMDGIATKLLLDIYGVQNTPTLIFMDMKGKSILTVPGYMPKKQFFVTLDFIEEKKWEGVSRKDGSVYKVLKEYYIEKGILKG